MPNRLILLLGVGVLAGCANMTVAPDPRADAYPSRPPLPQPTFRQASLVVSGAYRGGDRRYPGAALEAERMAWAAVRTALEEKGVARAVGGAESRGDAEILFEFLLEDDDDPLHRGFSLITLYCFPHWKMVRLSARARCKVGERFLPGFDFEDERLVYTHPVLLPFSPFAAGDPVRELCTMAGRAFTMHLIRSVEEIEPLVRQAEGAPDG